jgi:hypothetical protein
MRAPAHRNHASGTSSLPPPPCPPAAAATDAVLSEALTLLIRHDEVKREKIPSPTCAGTQSSRETTSPPLSFSLRARRRGAAKTISSFRDLAEAAPPTPSFFFWINARVQYSGPNEAD